MRGRGAGGKQRRGRRRVSGWEIETGERSGRGSMGRAPGEHTANLLTAVGHSLTPQCLTIQMSRAMPALPHPSLRCSVYSAWFADGCRSVAPALEPGEPCSGSGTCPSSSPPHPPPSPSPPLPLPSSPPSSPPPPPGLSRGGVPVDEPVLSLLRLGFCVDEEPQGQEGLPRQVPCLPRDR